MLDEIDFGDSEKPPSPAVARINTLASQIGIMDKNPFVIEMFQEDDFYHALPEEIRNNDEALRDLLINTSRFHDLAAQEQRKYDGTNPYGIFGEKVTIPETTHADGRVRRAEEGPRIVLDPERFGPGKHIDPSKVVFFRVSQSSNEPKPEYYWTTDYYETKRGLQKEISPEQRAKAVVLIATLDNINQNGGLIQDINDDNGIAVRQIGTGSFDQRKCLGSFKA